MIKEYLMQAYRIDQRINSKLEQIASLHDLATKATVTYSYMPSNPNKGKSKIEDAIIKIMELEDEINYDIDKLPLSEGGMHDRRNLIALCKSCHGAIHAERGDYWGQRVPAKPASWEEDEQ